MRYDTHSSDKGARPYQNHTGVSGRGGSMNRKNRVCPGW